MATRDNIPGLSSHECRIESWDLGQNDEGKIVDCLDYSRASFQLSGDLQGALARIVGRISTDHEFAPLKNSEGLPANLRDGQLFEVAHLSVAMLRPELHGGGPNTKVKVSALLRR